MAPSPPNRKKFEIHILRALWRAEGFSYGQVFFRSLRRNLWPFSTNSFQCCGSGMFIQKQQ
jgi:hypothetical protein